MDFKRFDITRIGLMAFMGVLLATLWIAVAYSAYEESKRAKYDVVVRPGNVTYGTRSTATVPMFSSSPRRSTVPMVTGGEIRHYAHYGHAAMPGETSGSGYRMHTTSSTAVSTIGSGGGGGGFASSGGGGGENSSRGIRYSSGYSVSVPMLAMTPSARTSTVYTPSSYRDIESVLASAAPARRGGMRRTPGSAGSYEGEETEDGGKIWVWDGEQWVLVGDIPVGTTKIVGDQTYRWDGSGWVLITDQSEEFEQPLGDAPWLLVVLLAMAYILIKAIRISKKAS